MDQQSDSLLKSKICSLKFMRFSVITCIMLCLTWSIIEPYLLRVSTHQIASKKIPQSWDQATIALIADLHIGRFTKTTKLDQVIQRLEQLKPDIIILAGDYVFHYQGDYNEIFSKFKPLTRHTPIFAVSGNHDHFENYKGIMDAITQNDITILDNQSQTMEYKFDSILLSGVPDLWYADFSTTHLPSANPNDSFHILVSHNPDFLVTHKNLFDLGLAGHTHGGQVTFFGQWAPFLPIVHKTEAWRGHVPFNNSDIVITNGIGTSILPMRFFAPPEISLITLKHLTNK